MTTTKQHVTFIGAGTIGTALGNILAENSCGDVLLHSVENQVVASIRDHHINKKYFPTLHLHPDLKATCDDRLLESSDLIFLAIPSVVMMDYLKKIRRHIPADALLVNLAKGFGAEHKTIIHCLKEEFPNPVCTLKGPSFAREIINRMPTGFTLGYEPNETANRVPDPVSVMTRLFKGTNIHLDYTTDIQGVEILSILKNMYAVILGIVDAQFNSANLRFLMLTKAFREMRRVLLYFAGKEDTLFKYCGYGDFALTSLNDLSRNRTLGLLIGKGFFTEHVSHELVLEGKTAVTVFYEEISKKVVVEEHFPIVAELYRIFNSKYDISGFVECVLNLPEAE